MIELSSQTYGAEEIAAINQVLESGRVTMGQEVLAFEREFAEYIGTRHAVMVNSGSSANLAMVAAMCATGRLRRGCKVYAPAMSWSTTIWPMLQYGLDPILVDCDDTLQMNPQALRETIAAFPGGKAMLVAHIMGNPSPMAEIAEICREFDLTLLEDSCETLGGDFVGIKTGRFGVAASFSFYFSHHMTTFEGGMVVTDDGVLDGFLRGIRSHGWSRAFDPAFQAAVAAEHQTIDPRFLFVCDGYNLRPMETQAAMGRVQLKHLPRFNRLRAEVYGRMCDIAWAYSELHPVQATPNATPAWFSFPVLVDGDRKAFVAHLEAAEIQTRPVVAGNLARHPAFHGLLKHASLSNADRWADHGLYWGLHPNITGEQLRGLADALAAYSWRKVA